VKTTRVYLLSFLLSTAFLSACLINERLALKLNVVCEEYVWDGEGEDGEWISGEGTLIKFDGMIEYSSLTTSELENVVAKITVYDVSGLKYYERIPIELQPSGTSKFSKEIDFENSFYCSEQKYSVSFYSPDRIVIPHKGDFENSIDNPLYSGLTPTPNLTTEAMVDSVVLTVGATYNATQPSTP
jgi:hypothetical protein